MNSTYEVEAFVGDPRRWAELQFGKCELVDTHRTQRLVEYAARQVAQPGASTNAVCDGAGDDFDIAQRFDHESVNRLASDPGDLSLGIPKGVVIAAPTRNTCQLT